MSELDHNQILIKTLDELKREIENIFFLSVDFTNRIHSLPIQNIINSPDLLPQARVLQNSCFLMNCEMFDRLEEATDAD